MGSGSSTPVNPEPARSSSNTQATRLKIYVLQLKENKYYVGKTTQIDFRLEQHFDATGSEWTKRYPPEMVIEIVDNADDFDEDKVVKRYMSKYGVNNVRGGSYCQFRLTPAEEQVLAKEITGAKDHCFNCGGQGHFANVCPTKKRCTRCGRNNHTVANCYAKTKIDGSQI